MATKIQMRRGTAAEHENFVGGDGEITVVTDRLGLRLHDGATPGGSALIMHSESSVTYDSVDAMTTSGDLVSVGDVLETRGYYTVGDGGAAKYVVEAGAGDGFITHNLTTGLIAAPMNVGHILLEQGGVRTDGSDQSGEGITRVFQYAKDNRITRITTTGGTIRLLSEIDIYQILGSVTYIQTFDGNGVYIDLSPSFSGTKVFNLGGSNSSVSHSYGRDFTFKNVHIDGRDYNSGSANGVTALYLTEAQEYTIDNIFVQHMGVAVSFGDTYYGTMSGGYTKIQNCGTGIELRDGLQMSNNSFNDIKINSCTYGVHFRASFCGTNFTNVTFENLDYVFFTDQEVHHATVSRRLTVERCYFEANNIDTFNMVGVISSNYANGVVFKDNYFNDSDKPIRIRAGTFEFYNNTGQPIVYIHNPGGYRCNVRTSSSLDRVILLDSSGNEMEYPQGSGTIQVEVVNRQWINGEGEGWSRLGDYDTYPSSQALWPSVWEGQGQNVLSPLPTGKISSGRYLNEMMPVRSMNPEDVIVYDKRKGFILRDRLDGNLYRLFVAGGELGIERTHRNEYGRPTGSIRCYELYKRANNGDYEIGDTEHARELNYDVEWNGSIWVRSGNTEAAIGTYQELSSTSHTGYWVPVYNVTTNEIWGSVNSGTIFRKYPQIPAGDVYKTATSDPVYDAAKGVVPGFVYYNTTASEYRQLQSDKATYSAYVPELPWY